MAEQEHSHPPYILIWVVLLVLTLAEVAKTYRSDEVLAGAPEKRSEPSGSRFDVSGSRLGRPMGRALSGRVAASDEQIREPEQQRDALRVLRQSPVAHLTVPEAPLHIQERMLHLRPHRSRRAGDALYMTNVSKVVLAVGLIFMAVWKAALVAMYYMHLRYEPARLWILAISPLPLAVILVLAVITEFY